VAVAALLQAKARTTAAMEEVSWARSPRKRLRATANRMRTVAVTLSLLLLLLLLMSASLLGARCTQARVQPWRQQQEAARSLRCRASFRSL
jgi:hypothetical protein